MTQIQIAQAYARSAEFELLQKELELCGTLPPFTKQFVRNFMSQHLSSEEMEEVSVDHVISAAHNI